VTCPPGKHPFRGTKDGPMPLVVYSDQMKVDFERVYPKLWIEVAPELPTFGGTYSVAHIGGR
jgi:hypothetical protein